MSSLKKYASICKQTMFILMIGDFVYSLPNLIVLYVELLYPEVAVQILDLADLRVAGGSRVTHQIFFPIQE